MSKPGKNVKSNFDYLPSDHLSESLFFLPGPSSRSVSNSPMVRTFTDFRIIVHDSRSQMDIDHLLLIMHWGARSENFGKIVESIGY